MKNYEHYKPGTNSRGLPSRDVKPPDSLNSGFALTNQQFRAACEKAGVEPTRRQASKYRRKTGKAYAAHVQPSDQPHALDIAAE